MVKYVVNDSTSQTDVSTLLGVIRQHVTKPRLKNKKRTNTIFYVQKKEPTHEPIHINTLGGLKEQ